MLSAYLSQLTPMEQKVLHIAASHLETSFSLVKSIGFQEWQAQQAEPQVPKAQIQAPKEEAPKAQAPKEEAKAPKKIRISKKLLAL